MFPIFEKPLKTTYQQNMDTAKTIQKLCFPCVKELIKNLDGKYIGKHQKPVKVTWSYHDDDFVRATLNIQYPPYGVMTREITYGSRLHFRCVNTEISIENIEVGFVKRWNESGTDHKDYYAQYKKISEFDLQEIVAGINERIEDMISKNR